MTSQTSSIAGNILAIDTSGTRGSLALQSRDQRFTVEWDKKAMHSELATVKLQEVLALSGVPIGELDRILVNAGPGSFTGIRVGLNLARTLAYSLAIPIAAMNSLTLLASRHDVEGSLFVAVRAIQTFYYAAGFAVNEAGHLVERLAPTSVAEADLEVCASGFEKKLIDGRTQEFSTRLEASYLLDLWQKRPDTFQFSTWKEVRPVYIRASEAEEKLLKGLLKA